MEIDGLGLVIALEGHCGAGKTRLLTSIAKAHAIATLPELSDTVRPLWKRPWERNVAANLNLIVEGELWRAVAAQDFAQRIGSIVTDRSLLSAVAFAIAWRDEMGTDERARLVQSLAARLTAAPLPDLVIRLSRCATEPEKRGQDLHLLHGDSFWFGSSSIAAQNDALDSILKPEDLVDARVVGDACGADVQKLTTSAVEFFRPTARTVLETLLETI